MALTFCLAEDRFHEEVGLRLALVTLRRWCPSARVIVYRPDPTADFRQWLQGFPQVRLIPDLPPGASAWNCKPNALIPLLEADTEEVIWLDSDILLARDPTPLFAARAPEELVVAQEAVSLEHQGTALRTAAWGLELGRTYSVTLNSGVIRASRHHLPLLRRWQTLLQDEGYLTYQRRPLGERPIAMMGDQDVLGALVGSKPFASLRLGFLRPGRDVIYSGGALAYSLWERLSGLFHPIPPLIHGIGTKPWIAFHPDTPSTGWFWFYRKLLQEASPYVALARRHRAEVGIPCPWLDVHTPLGLLSRFLGCGHFALRGLPLTVLAMMLVGGQSLVARLKPAGRRVPVDIPS